MVSVTNGDGLNRWAKNWDLVACEDIVGEVRILGKVLMSRGQDWW